MEEDFQGCVVRKNKQSIHGNCNFGNFEKREIMTKLNARKLFAIINIFNRARILRCVAWEFLYPPCERFCCSVRRAGLIIRANASDRTSVAEPRSGVTSVPSRLTGAERRVYIRDLAWPDSRCAKETPEDARRRESVVRKTRAPWTLHAASPTRLTAETSTINATPADLHCAPFGSLEPLSRQSRELPDRE